MQLRSLDDDKREKISQVYACHGLCFNNSNQLRKGLNVQKFKPWNSKSACNLKQR